MNQFQTQHNKKKNLTFGIVILCAGKSERMGQPKALLELNGIKFINIMLKNAFLQNSNVTTTVITGHHHNQIGLFIPEHISITYNPCYESGRMSSVKKGVHFFKSKVDAVFVWPVDCPLISGNVFDKMTDFFNNPSQILIPSYDYKRGHPPLFGSAWFDELLGMKDDQPLRDIYKKYQNTLEHVVVDEPEILHNINTPDSYKEILNLYRESEQNSEPNFFPHPGTDR